MEPEFRFLGLFFALFSYVLKFKSGAGNCLRLRFTPRNDCKKTGNGAYNKSCLPTKGFLCFSASILLGLTCAAGYFAIVKRSVCLLVTVIITAITLRPFLLADFSPLLLRKS